MRNLSLGLSFFALVFVFLLKDNLSESAPVNNPAINHAPVIYESKYKTRIGLRKRGEVIAVRAYDPDNPPLIYKAVQWTPASGESIFELDSNTGVISVKPQVTIPPNTVFKVTVTVDDGMDTSDPVTVTIITRRGRRGGPGGPGRRRHGRRRWNVGL